jgi:hypothetical protein
MSRDMPALTCGTTGSAGGSPVLIRLVPVRHWPQPVSTVYRYQRPHRIHEAIAQFNPYQEAILTSCLVKRLIAWASCCRAKDCMGPTFGFEASIAFRYITDDHNTCIVHARHTFNSQLKSSPSTWCMGWAMSGRVLVESDLDSHATENIGPRLAK